MQRRDFKHTKPVIKIEDTNFDDDGIFSLNQILNRPAKRKKKMMKRLRSMGQNMQTTTIGNKYDRIKSMQREILEEDVFNHDDDMDNDNILRVAPKYSNNHFGLIKDSLQHSYDQEHKLDPSISKNPYKSSGLSMTDTDNLFKSLNILQA